MIGGVGSVGCMQNPLSSETADEGARLLLWHEHHAEKLRKRYAEDRGRTDPAGLVVVFDCNGAIAVDASKGTGTQCRELRGPSAGAVLLGASVGGANGRRQFSQLSANILEMTSMSILTGRNIAVTIASSKSQPIGSR